MDYNKLISATIKSLGIVVFGIAAIAIYGVATDNEALRSWGRPIPMPLNVSVCLVAVGLALFLLARLHDKS